MTVWREIGMGSNGRITEEDLYAPVRDYLTERGFSVKGEVEHCDIAAVKGETLPVVEMKLTLFCLTGV